MSTILTKRYQREKDIPTTGLQAGELIIAIDTRSLWMCISTDERVKVSDNINLDDFLKKGLNLEDVPDKEMARFFLEVYSKTEVDHFLQGLRWKAPVKAITDRSIELRREQEIDGIPVLEGDRVLVNNQSARYDNGIYVVSREQWTRAEDADTANELLNAAVFVSMGATRSDTAWVCTTDPPILLGMSTIRFVQFSALTYVHPSGFTNQPPTSNLANAVVISRILVNSEGHVTGINTRSLTPANIGAAPASHSHALLTRGNGLSGGNYDGSAPVSWAVDFAGNGEAVTVARSDHNHDNQYAPYGHNHYLTSLADVLIDTLADGDVLKYDSATDNWVNARAGGEQYWSRADGALSPSNANDRVFIQTNIFTGLEVYNSSASSSDNAAISAYSTNGVGIYAGGGLYGLFAYGEGSGTALFATSTTALAAEFSTEDGSAFYALATGTGNGGSISVLGSGVGLSVFSREGIPAILANNTDAPEYNNSITEILRLDRNHSSFGSVAPGFGMSIDFHIQPRNGFSFLNSRFASTLTSADAAHIVTNFEWSLMSDGYFRQVMELSDDVTLSLTSEQSKLALKSYHKTNFIPGFLKSGDNVGILSFDAWASATTYASVAGIIVKATADHTASNFASQLEFWLAAPNSTVPRQVGEFTPAGKLRGIFGFSVFGSDGISGTSTVLTGVGYNSLTKTLEFTRSTLTVDGGIVTAVAAASNININLS